MDNENAKKANGGTENTAGAEERKEAAPDLGKFKSVDALLKAYSALEAEFTRRNQRLKELEEENKATDVRELPSRESEDLFLQTVLSDGNVKKAVIEEYLKSLASGAAPLITGGVTPAAPRAVPKSVKEAGALAQRFLKKD
ncbi:MAG: hypothetical protein K2N30_04460 [Clostridia bacterium]|nr:hypothetical protein [Clostridia bacterium]